MQLGARGAQRDRQATKKLSNYSKQWAAGDTMRCMVPIIWLEDGRPDLRIGQVWGHPVNDIKGLGLKTSFIPTTTEFDKDGYPVGTPDVTYQFSRIAPVFVQGQRTAELTRTAGKPWPTTAQREQALDDVKKKYDKANRDCIKPIIGPAKFLILTEVVSVKFIEGTGCKRDTIAVSSWPLSDKMLQQIFALMDNPKFAPQKGDEFFEFEITYPTNPDKGQSGLAAVPAGLTSDYLLRNQYPDDFEIVKSFFGNWSQDSETIRNRATRSISPEDVHEAIRQYSMMNSEYLDSLEPEGEDVKTLLKNIDIVASTISTRFMKNEAVRDMLQEAISKIDANKDVSVETPMPDVAAPAPAPTVADAAPATHATEEPPVLGAPALNLDINTEAPRMSELLMHNTNNLGSDAEMTGMLGDVLGDGGIASIV